MAVTATLLLMDHRVVADHEPSSRAVTFHVMWEITRPVPIPVRATSLQVKWPRPSPASHCDDAMRQWYLATSARLLTCFLSWTPSAAEPGTAADAVCTGTITPRASPAIARLRAKRCKAYSSVV